MKPTNFPKRRETRKTEALARQEEHDKLSIEQKLQKLDACKFTAARERIRLEAEMGMRATNKSKKAKD